MVVEQIPVWLLSTTVHIFLGACSLFADGIHSLIVVNFKEELVFDLSKVFCAFSLKEAAESEIDFFRQAQTEIYSAVSLRDDYRSLRSYVNFHVTN